MAKKRKQPELENPWGFEGEEITEPGIGVGFVEWREPGEWVRGVMLRRWQSRAMRTPAVTIALTDEPRVTVVNTEGDGDPVELSLGAGEKVNLSLTIDLERKLTRDLEGEEIGVQYVDDKPTPKGAMRVYRVMHLPGRSHGV